MHIPHSPIFPPSVSRRWAAGLQVGLIVLGLMVAPGASQASLFSWVSGLFSGRQGPQETLTFAEHTDKADPRTPDPVVNLTSLGRPVMLVMWSVGCMPCLQELQALNKIVDRIRAKGGEVIPVLISRSLGGGATWGSVVAFLTHASRSGGGDGPDKRWVDLYPNLKPYYDHLGLISSHFEISATPTTVFLDKKGKVVHRHEGYVDWSDAAGQELLAQHLVDIR